MFYKDLYSATYSGVPVYELVHPRCSVMRRKNDDWVNATHILKVANFPKAKRTRILERDVQTGVHEKVQGGYGKYQGTWVPMNRAVQLAKQYGVFTDLQPILEFDSSKSDWDPPPAPKHHHASSKNSRKATLARRSATMPAVASKALRSGEKLDTSITVKRAYSTISGSRHTRGRKRTLKAPSRKRSGLYRSQSSLGARTVSSGQSLRNNNTHSMNAKAPTATPKTIPSDSDSFSLESESDENSAGPNRLPSIQQVRNPSDTSSQVNFLSDADIDKALAAQRRSPSSRLLKQQQAQSGIDDVIMGSNRDEDKKMYTQKLLEYFLSSEDDSNTPIPPFIKDKFNSEIDLNQQIDNDGNTVFHWACAMGDLLMCQALMNRGTNSRSLNNKGEVPIMRSVMYTNSYNRRTFAKILDLLRDSLLDTDVHGRTILHHIALSTSFHSIIPAARYYTEILLTKVAETVQPMERIINFINQQDSDGNTALHIMSYNGAQKCIRILLGYNARIDIPNSRNEYVSDFLYSNNVLGADTGNYGGSQPLQSLNGMNSAVDSLGRMHVFNPSFGYQKSVIQAGKPINTPSFTSNSTQPSQLNTPGGMAASTSILTTPHYSEAAMQISQRSEEIVDKIAQLAGSFDAEVQQKESDVKELKVLLIQLDQDIDTINKNLSDVYKKVMGNDIRTRSQDNIININAVEKRVKKLKAEHVVKVEHLQRLMERSQAKDLAITVQKTESEDLAVADEGTEDKKPLHLKLLDKETLELLLELAKLQIIRKKRVHGLVLSYADTSKNNKTIDSYRRLVSKLSRVPLEEVDGSLNEIEQCLKDDATDHS